MMINNAARIKSAIILTKQDSQTITALKKEVEKAWRLIDVAKEKEEKARQIIQSLRGEIAQLTKIVEEGSGLSLGQDNTVHDLMRKKDDLQKECDEKSKRIADQDENITTLNQKNLALESQIARKDDDYLELKKELDNTKEQLK